MRTFTSILADVDAMAAVHPALDRAIDTARQCGARLKIVDVLDIPREARALLPAGVEAAVIGQRNERLAQFAARAEGLGVETEVLVGPPAETLIQEVVSRGHDLLVRSHARDLAAPHPSRLGTVDMQLFRQCPCAVWAVGPGASGAPRRIVAAVHATSAPEEQALNRTIVETALLFADAPGSTLTICQAWAAFGETLLHERYSRSELAAYAGAAEQEARGQLHALVASFGPQLTNARVHLEKGQPENVIPPLVVSEGIDLVVMGTVARTGVIGLIMGNTAERMLQRLPCSVIALKPEGFVTPHITKAGADDASRRRTPSQA